MLLSSAVIWINTTYDLIIGYSLFMDHLNPTCSPEIPGNKNMIHIKVIENTQ